MNTFLYQLKSMELWSFITTDSLAINFRPHQTESRLIERTSLEPLKRAQSWVLFIGIPLGPGSPRYFTPSAPHDFRSWKGKTRRGLLGPWVQCTTFTDSHLPKGYPKSPLQTLTHNHKAPYLGKKTNKQSKTPPTLHVKGNGRGEKVVANAPSLQQQRHN